MIKKGLGYYYCECCQTVTSVSLGLLKSAVRCSHCHEIISEERVVEGDDDLGKASEEIVALSKVSERSVYKRLNKSSVSGKQALSEKKQKLIFYGCIWGVMFLGFGGLFFIVYQLRMIERNSAQDSVVNMDQALTRQIHDNDFTLLQMKRLSAIIFSSYIQEVSIDNRAAFVYRSFDSLLKMRRFYEKNPKEFFMDFPEMKVVGLVNTDTGKAIQSTWLHSGSNSIWELSLRSSDGDEWLIDWEEFVRYNPEPWSFLLSKTTTGTGIFRVWAELLSSSKIVGGRESCILRLYSPHPNGSSPERVVRKSQSVDVYIPLDSPLYRQLKETCSLLDKEQRSERCIGLYDAHELMRLRLNLKKSVEASSGVSPVEVESIVGEGWNS